MMEERSTPETRPDLRATLAVQHANAVFEAERITGRECRRESSLRNAFLSGFDAGMEAAGKGELVAENRALHGELLDSDFTTDSMKAAANEMLTALEEVTESAAYRSLDALARTVVEMAIEKAKR